MMDRTGGIGRDEDEDHEEEKEETEGNTLICISKPI